MHPHDLAVSQRVHNGRLSAGLILVVIDWRADPGAADSHDHVIARRDQFDRLDRRHSPSPPTDHVDHLLAVAAYQLGPDPLVNDIRRKPAGHCLDIAPSHRVKPVREDDLDIALGCAGRCHAPSVAALGILPCAKRLISCPPMYHRSPNIEFATSVIRRLRFCISRVSH